MSAPSKYAPLSAGAAASLAAVVVSVSGYRVSTDLLIAAPVVVGSLGHAVTAVEKVVAAYRSKKNASVAARLAAAEMAAAAQHAAFLAAVRSAAEELVAAKVIAPETLPALGIKPPAVG